MYQHMQVNHDACNMHHSSCIGKCQRDKMIAACVGMCQCIMLQGVMNGACMRDGMIITVTTRGVVVMVVMGGDGR